MDSDNGLPFQELAAYNDALPVGMFSTDLDGRCTYINKTLETLTGLSREQALGHGWLSALHLDDRDRVAGEWLAAAAARRSCQMTYRLQPAAEWVVWVMAKAAPVVVDGKCTAFVSVVEDITATREAEQARSMLSAILEASTDFVATTDFGSHVCYINPAGRRLRGLAANTPVVGTTIADYFPPWVVKCLAEEAAPAAMRYGVWSGETAVWDRERRELPIQHMVIAQSTPEGRVDFFASIMRDMSAQKATESAFRESRARLRLITNNVPALISYVDANERFQFSN